MAHGSHPPKCLSIDGFPSPPSSFPHIHPETHADARDTYGTTLAAIRGMACAPAFLEQARDMGTVMDHNKNVDTAFHEVKSSK